MNRTLLTFIFIPFLSIAYSQDNRTLIRFQELTVEIHGLAPFENNDLNQAFTNKAFFTADLAETFDSTTIIVSGDAYSGIEVYQSYETSITISDEGPHCDLTEWRHYTSNWIKLKELKSSTFISAALDSTSSHIFPKVNMNQVIKAAKKSCGQRWADLIMNTKSIYDYPCDVDISKFYLKIIAKEKASGKRIEKIIEISIPMGC